MGEGADYRDRLGQESAVVSQAMAEAAAAKQEAVKGRILLGDFSVVFPAILNVSLGVRAQIITVPGALVGDCVAVYQTADLPDNLAVFGTTFVTQADKVKVRALLPLLATALTIPVRFFAIRS